MKKYFSIICMLSMLCTLSGCADVNNSSADSSITTVQTADSSSPSISEENNSSAEQENAAGVSQEA